MIKNRSFMIGLGSGLLVGALLLQLMNVGTAAQVLSDAPADKLTKEQLQEQAEAMDMELVDAGDKRMTEEEWKQQMVDKSSKAQGSEVKSPKAADKTDAPKAPDQPAQPESKTEDSTPKTEEPAAGKSPKTPKSPSIKVKIASGSNLTDVASKLKQSGIISDTAAFVEKGRSKKMSTKIQSGTYEFAPGEDFNSIISKITTKPPS
ncbi:endolytic transglycosylase MltG [Paenibacillus chibensis]|uniref:endolytic transglycosylase MltG n=1 Tax=Paenibacillus chibensis TaxID=59846 RepID=UPI000FD93F8D|nr:endolytic transglycosylase MltG [Paenibacillus chibensis]MEC0373049.1 endolytic transglycosylase MltG [Paenibacillus chibensis]